MKIVALSAVLLLLCLVAVSSAEEFDFFYLVQQVSKNPFIKLEPEDRILCGVQSKVCQIASAMNLTILVWFVVAWIFL
jgi:hypothetical protein